MQYSPKLKKAMEEIKEILRKHDIAASIVLHTPGHGEFLNHITPTYSCGSIDEVNGKFELKGRKIHFKNEAERLNKLRDTANMLSIMADLTGRNALNLMQASDFTDKNLNSEHSSGDITSHNQQNN